MSEEFIANDEEGLILVTVDATEYFDVPKVDVVIPTALESSLKWATPHFRNNYFRDLLDDNVRVKFINGYPVNLDFSALFCDYCQGNIGSSPDGYWHCWDCHKDMCNLCKTEINEEIALQNGAKNYASRKDALLACLGQEGKVGTHFLQKRKTFSTYGKQCDVCQGYIDRFETCYTNAKLNKDACLKCENSQAGQEKIVEWKLERYTTDVNMYWKETQFGNMMDWIPVLYDEEGFISINCNPHSDMYQRICLTTGDDHGRSGYFIARTTLLKEMLQEMEMAYTKLKQDDEHLTPIQSLMYHLNMPIYYG